jgi:hypothetical protein
MINYRKYFAGIIAVLACVLFVCGCGDAIPRKSGDVTAEIAIIPEANMIIKTDYAAIHKSEFNRKIQEFSEEKLAIPGFDTDSTMDEINTLIEETLGLKSDDILSIIGSAKILGDSLDVFDDFHPDSVELVAAFQLGKALTLDQLRAFFEAVAKQGEVPVVILTGSVGGVDCLIVGDGDPDESIYLSLSSDRKLLLAGTRNGVTNALNRAATPVSLGHALANTGVPVRELPSSVVSFVLSDAMRTELNQELSNASDEIEQTIAESLRNMKAVTLGVNLDKTAEMTLYVNLASPESAEILKNLAQNMLLPSIRMGATLITQGKSLPVLNTLKTDASGTVASMSLELSIEDIEILSEMLDDLENMF